MGLIQPYPDLGTPRTSPDADPAAAGVGVGRLAFFGLAIASLGGPLGLAAQYLPALVREPTASAGFVALAGAVLFVAPLLIWLRYAREIAGPGGLYGYARAGLPGRLALLQAGLWIVSYLLYLVYTSADIVYDLLPSMLPGERRYQTMLQLALPVAVAVILVAGRRLTLGVLGLLAVGQLGLTGALAAVSLHHAAPASSFVPHRPAGDVLLASAGVALLFVCGSLPLFAGGEVKAARRTIPPLLAAAFGLVAVLAAITVFPLAANPAFTRVPVPGVAVARVFGGPGFGTAVAVGVAASEVGLMIAEYFALSRLLHAVTHRPLRPILWVLAGVLVLSGPAGLLAPEFFAEGLLRPSLVALWLSQLAVFVAYPRFIARRRRLRADDWVLTAVAGAVSLFGLYAAITGHVVS